LKELKVRLWNSGNKDLNQPDALRGEAGIGVSLSLKNSADLDRFCPKLMVALAALQQQRYGKHQNCP
jgi:hypothetical protein